MDDRQTVYTLFERYTAWLKQSRQYDSNLLSHQYLPQAEPRYDAIFVDEVQDMTPVQLQLVLKTLRHPGQFYSAVMPVRLYTPAFSHGVRSKVSFSGNTRGTRLPLIFCRRTTVTGTISPHWLTVC